MIPCGLKWPIYWNIVVEEVSYFGTVIEFDDKASKEERWQFEKSAYIREFSETVNERNASRRSPSPYLAIDETLYLYCGSIGMEQYNPGKLAKQGLLYHGLYYAVVAYMYYTLSMPVIEKNIYGSVFCIRNYCSMVIRKENNHSWYNVIRS